jgi:two-component system NtrC family sensor kinase
VTTPPGATGSAPAGRLHPGRRLAVRMGLALCLGAAAILWVADQASLRWQRAQLEDLVGVSADRIAETIRRATHDGMLRNDADEVQRIIANIAAQEGIARIRIYNKEGRVRTSSLHQEEGTLVGLHSLECAACHAHSQPRAGLDRRDRIRIFRAEDGSRILGIIAPIYNQPACASCHVHPASQRVLGVLDVQLSLTQVDAVLRASERQMTYGLVATVVAVLVLTFLLLWRMVLSPVQKLTGAMARTATGDLSVRVPVRSDNEIGRMARSWNDMTDELGRARNALEQWNRTLEERVEEKTRELEKAHQQMVLVEKMASLGKLAAVVAHEINNPLAGIRTYARLLRRRLAGAPPPTPEDVEETDRILEMVDGEAGRCGDIVRNLLAFSRQSGARLSQEDIAPVVERCRLLLNHQAEMLGICLEARVSSERLRVVCDAAQVQQMLLALAMNALEATPAGGRVTIEARPDGDGVALVVSDTGHGIPAEDRDRIFEPFFTTKEEGKGVGLGLAVVYGIVERHRGTVDVRSVPGEGTTFTVHLPGGPSPSLRVGEGVPTAAGLERSGPPTGGAGE